jgi:glucose/arabinose dehydrogenase
MKSRLGLGVGLLLALAGCSGPTEEPVDSGVRADAFAVDTGVPVDSGPPNDTGVVPVDTGVVPVDTGTPEDTGAMPVDAFVATDAGMMTTGCELTGYPALAMDELRSTTDSSAAVTGLVIAPGRDDIFVVERDGPIRIMDPATGAVGATPFINLHSVVGTHTSDGDERGLLGLAFHPDFAANGLFYVAYTPHLGSAENRVAVGHVPAATPDVAEPTVTTILAIPDFASNHNGGQLQFGPDGYLYVGTGDGGLADDTRGNGQDTTQLLGKILRLDVNATGYTIPATNPFAGSTTDAEEIWAYGARNPWRFSFDRLTGDMFIADVGQDAWEEIDFVAAGTGAGDNFGWAACEGTHNHGAAGACAALTNHHPPIYEYSHGGTAPIRGQTITGGYVYRGAVIPGLNGAYLFADAYGGVTAALRYCGGAVRDAQRIESLSDVCSVTTFGEDAAGEILVGCLYGDIYRITPG